MKKFTFYSIMLRVLSLYKLTEIMHRAILKKRTKTGNKNLTQNQVKSASRKINKAFDKLKYASDRNG